MSLPRRINPLPIQICSKQIAPVVANNNTIDVKHRDDLKNEVVSKLSSNRVVAQQKVNNVFDKVAHHGFARMHSGCQEYDFFLFYRRRTRIALSYGDVVTVVTTLRQTECLAAESVLVHLVIL